MTCEKVLDRVGGQVWGDSIRGFLCAAVTILTHMMADEFNFLGSEIQNYIAEADADLIPVPGQFELHGRCRYGVLLSPCFGALYLLQI